MSIPTYHRTGALSAVDVTADVITDVTAFTGDRYGTGILSHDLSTELGRLRLLESELDPASHHTLRGRGIQPSWRVLEVGAGAGSLARWLAAQVPDGTVTAIDVDTRFLPHDEAGATTAAPDTDAPPRPGLPPNLDVVEGDVRTHDFPADSFELIHARTVLLHIPERDAVLERLASWLSPGGVLVTEDLVIQPADSSPHPVFRRGFNAIEQAMAASIGTDLRWARSFPVPLRRAGLVETGISAQYYPAGGRTEIGRLWRATFAQSADFLASSGLLDPTELAETLALLADPDFHDLGPSIVAAWGRRAAR